MTIEKTYPKTNIPRLLGAAFTFVFLASLSGGLLHAQALGVGAFAGPADISAVLLNVANNVSLLRVSILIELANAAAIIALATLLYLALQQQNRVLALLALGWWLAEGLMMVISKMGTYALIPLSRQFVAAGAPEAGAPEAAHFQTLGVFLYEIVDETGYDLHVGLFCIGALLWYYLLYRSGLVPRWLAGWGLAAIALMTIPSLIMLYDPSQTFSIAFYVPYIPFELFIGIWLMVKGFNSAAPANFKPALVNAN